MSEEEKRAIKWLENSVIKPHTRTEDINDIEILLNLIDKYQKEIEELKIHLKTQNGFSYFAHQQIMKNYISKDKIREKIKELEERTKQEKTITFYCNSNDITRTVISNFKELLEENIEESNS